MCRLTAFPDTVAPAARWPILLRLWDFCGSNAEWSPGGVFGRAGSASEWSSSQSRIWETREDAFVQHRPPERIVVGSRDQGFDEVVVTRILIGHAPLDIFAGRTAYQIHRSDFGSDPLISNSEISSPPMCLFRMDFPSTPPLPKCTHVSGIIPACLAALGLEAASSIGARTAVGSSPIPISRWMPSPGGTRISNPTILRRSRSGTVMARIGPAR